MGGVLADNLEYDHTEYKVISSFFYTFVCDT